MAPIPGGAAFVAALHDSASAMSWSSCLPCGCQNLRWIRSWAVLGCRYSYCCSLICAIKVLSSPAILRSFFSMSSLRLFSMFSFSVSVKNTPSTAGMWMLFSSSMTASPMQPLSTYKPSKLKTCCARAM